MSVCCECCVLSGRGLCDELITRPEESHQLWCVVVCDLETLVNDVAMAHWGRGGLLSQKQIPPLKFCIFKHTYTTYVFIYVSVKHGLLLYAEANDGK